MTPFEKADEAKRLIQNPVLNEALDAIKASLVAKLEQVPIGDLDTQHEVALMLQLLRRVKDQLHQFLNEYAVEEHKQKQATFLERMRRRA